MKDNELPLSQCELDFAVYLDAKLPQIYAAVRKFGNFTDSEEISAITVRVCVNVWSLWSLFEKAPPSGQIVRIILDRVIDHLLSKGNHDQVEKLRMLL